MSIKKNIVLDQATDFTISLPLVDNNGDPINLSGYTANSVMRRWYTSNVFISFNTSINAIMGIITLGLDASISANSYPGRYVYDVTINNGIVTSRVYEGEIFITPAVTANTILTNVSNTVIVSN